MPGYWTRFKPFLTGRAPAHHEIRWKNMRFTFPAFIPANQIVESILRN